MDGGRSISSQSTLSKKLTETACEVLLGAAEFGLEWSGEKLLGSNGWEGFKKIFKPVLVKLKEKFPMLKFGKSDDAQSVETARKAVIYLQQNPELQNLLVQGFSNLEQGQHEILASVDQLGDLMEANHEEIVKILIQMDEKLSDHSKLPVYVDVSDDVERTFLLSKNRAKREGREFNQDVSVFLAGDLGQGLFMTRVLEKGEPFVRYKTKKFMAEWYATPSSQLHDSKGRICRKLSRAC